MEEDIQNYSPIVMFRETPCTWTRKVIINENYSNHDKLMTATIDTMFVNQKIIRIY